MIENKYQNGKIYKIIDVGYNRCYIGSTVESLSKRMCKHRAAYNTYLKDETGSNCTSYHIFKEFGLKHCKIELLENYPCHSKAELNAREGFHIKNIECVNKVIPGRTQKEWAEDTDYHKTYRIKHQDAIKAYRGNHKDKADAYNMSYREEHRNEIKQHNTIYYQENKEQILNLRKEKTSCECGSKVCRGDIQKHLRTIKHQEFMKNKISI